MSWLKAGAGAVGTSTPTPPLFSVSCRGTTRQGDVDVFVIVVFHFVDNVEQACTLEPASVDIFDDYHLKGRIHLLSTEEIEKVLYKALRIYGDPSTLKAYNAYRNFGTRLLQKL